MKAQSEKLEVFSKELENKRITKQMENMITEMKNTLEEINSTEEQISELEESSGNHCH